MSKGLKKVVKSVAKVATLGATGSDGWGTKAVSVLSGGLVGGDSSTDDLAKTQRDIAAAQAKTANDESIATQQGNAQQIQLDADKQAATLAAEANQPIDTTTVDVSLADTNDESTSAVRKRFNSTSTNAGNGGPAIRV